MAYLLLICACSWGGTMHKLTCAQLCGCLLALASLQIQLCRACVVGGVVGRRCIVCLGEVGANNAPVQATGFADELHAWGISCHQSVSLPPERVTHVTLQATCASTTYQGKIHTAHLFLT
jgi:hypothetical protein